MSWRRVRLHECRWYLPGRVINCLRRNLGPNVTLGHLAGCPDAHLLACRDFGRGGLAALRRLIVRVSGR